jgi:hypothetical protein
MPMDTCPHCGSADFVRGVKLGQRMEPGEIGLEYRGPRVLLITVQGTEALCADLCKACGTVARFYVRTPDREWVTDNDEALPPSLPPGEKRGREWN